MSDNAPPRRIRHIQPLGLRVLVRVIPDANRSPGGLYLPEGVAEEHHEALYAEVVEVARSSPDEETLGTNVSGIPAGSKVLFPKDTGIVVPWDEALRILESKDVLALVDEFDYEEAH